MAESKTAPEQLPSEGGEDPMTAAEARLLRQISEAIAEAKVAAVAANAAAATANLASAGAGATTARTQSNIESAIDRAMSQVTSLQQAQVESDIDTPEAWKANVKRTYDVHQSHDMEVMQRNRVHFDTLVTQLQTHLANVNQLTLAALANNQNQSNLCNTLAIDRSWNINETDLSAKSAAALTDRILAEAAKVDKPEAK